MRPIEDEWIEGLRIFYPYAHQRSQEVYTNNLDFVHYTSASNAFRIIENREVTLRNAVLMNDFSEIDHGEKCLQNAWNSRVGKGENPSQPGRLAAILDSIDPLLVPAIERGYDQHLRHRRLDTYLLSLSEHDDSTEGHLGKLSMWRAYGGRTNVALVVDHTPFLRPTTANVGFTSPVLYSEVAEFEQYFNVLCDSLEANIDEVRSMPPATVHSQLTGAFNAAAVSTKHPGFSEEREWRIVYTPWLSASEAITSRRLVIGETPQVVQVIRLEDREDIGFVGVSPNALLKKVIIGPTENPYILYKAFVSLLEDAGVQNAGEKVVVSKIPIRR